MIFGGNKQKATITVTTMRCGHCAKRIEEALAAHKIKCNIDLNTKNVTVFYKEEKTSLDEIKKIITDLGYEVA